MTHGEDDWVFYRDRPEWKDVVPVPQNDGPVSIVAIAYKEKFRDVYDYFRGILKVKEHSERALELTKDALDLNPGNYSVWHYRREIIKALDKDLKEELAYTEDMMKASEKNYQVWHHRRMIVDWAQDASEEDRVTRYFLSSDPKNYHAWQHRQWYIRAFNLFEGELNFVESLIDDDVRNNSAWNQRYFVVNYTSQWTEDVANQEIDYAISQIKIVRRNESSWNYLRGVLMHADDYSALLDKVKQFCGELLQEGESSPYLYGFVVDLIEENVGNDQQFEFLTASKALELCDLLATKEDTIRVQYWNWVKGNIIKKAQLKNIKVGS